MLDGTVHSTKGKPLVEWTVLFEMTRTNLEYAQLRHFGFAKKKKKLKNTKGKSVKNTKG